MITTDNAPVTALQAAFAHVQQEHLVTAAEFPVVWCNAPEAEVLKAYNVDDGKMFLTEAEFQEIMSNSANRANVVQLFGTPKRADLNVDLYRNKGVENNVDLSGMKWVMAIPDLDLTLAEEVPVEVVPGPIETHMGLSVPRVIAHEVLDIQAKEEPIVWNKTDGIIEYLHIFKNIPTKDLDVECSSKCFRELIVGLKRILWFNDDLNVELARRLRKEGFPVNYVSYKRELTVIVHPDGPFVWKV